MHPARHDVWSLKWPSFFFSFCLILFFFLFSFFHKYNIQAEEKKKYNEEQKPKQKLRTRPHAYNTTSITYYTYTQNKQKYHKKNKKLQLTNMHFSRIIVDNKLTRIKTLRKTTTQKTFSDIIVKWPIFVVVVVVAFLS